MSDMTLEEAKARVVEVFTEIQASGVDVMLEFYLGAFGLDLVVPGTWDRVKLTNEDWHPEWSE